MTDTASPQLYSPRDVRFLVACLMLALLMVAFNQTLLSTALPTIAGELGGADRIAWVVSGFVLTSTASMPIYGSLSDVVGRRGLLALAIVIFTGGSVAAALATTMDGLIVCRLIQGVGGGGLLVLSQTILADAVPARERAKYAGVFGAVWAVASVIGPLLGGWFTDGPGWNWAFWLNVPIGAIALGLTLRFVKPSQSRLRPEPDFFGIIFLLIGTTTVVLLATWAGTVFEWNSPETVGMAAISLASATGFVFAEYRAVQPIMSLKLFRDRTFVLATGAALLVSGIAMFAVVTYLPVYVQMVMGLNATESGLILIPMIGSILVSSAVTGYTVTRTGRYKLIPIVGSVIVGIALVLMSTMDASTTVFEVCAYSALMGAGLGTVTQLLVLIVQNALPAIMVGSATASNNYFRQVGAAVGISAVGSAFTATLATTLAGTRIGDTAVAVDLETLTPSVLAQMPVTLQSEVAEAYSAALPPLFLLLSPLALVATVLLAFLETKPLANHQKATGDAEYEI
ncbi:MDR family MFS transporter [Salinibacterium sp. TMP30]|uniref:MDR family MFS transporter n=1 Tax=Salinibacterium sp. TMP30 TaxID=3138237 RepID=UPI003138F239